jgi:hypothetical protein
MNIAFLALTAAGLARVVGPTAQVVNSGPDHGQEGGVCSEWVNADAPQCVAISKVGSVSHLTKLTP